ncbi:MAG: S26 family signal peptidase [Tepidisphaeraceae bacterium]
MTAAAPSTDKHAKPEAGVKETVESILIAFILAFIFRCFVVEAFVIPTGSMAPTLMGAHLSYRCPDCGYRFTAGFPDQDDNFSVPEVAEKTYSIICPNCGLRLPRSLPSDKENDADSPAVRYGDRILVMKYLYLLAPPKRWDVVVFKTPDVRGAAGDYSVNYIKRLVGKPGERLFVAEGDVYVAPDNGQPMKESDFVVQPKPKSAQDALWRIVYDADYVPAGKIKREYTASNGGEFADQPWQQPWKPNGGSGWTNSDDKAGVDARHFAFDNKAGQGTLAFDTNANPNTAAMTDWLAYDQTDRQTLRDGKDTLDRPSYKSDNGAVKSVSDLKLSAVVDAFSGEGKLRLVVGKQDESGSTEFAAEITADKIRLIKRIGGSERTIGEIDRPTDATEVSIQNVDYRVAINVAGKERLATTPADYAPDVASVVRREQDERPAPAGFARIDGDRCQATLSHLQLWRDVYYRARRELRPAPRDGH